MLPVTTLTNIISSPTSNVDIKANFSTSNNLPYVFHQIVNSGVTITGTAPSTSAIDTNTGWHGGAQITLENLGTTNGGVGSNGTIGSPGSGGAGGTGGTGVFPFDNGSPGSGGGAGGPGSAAGNGGDALKVQVLMYLKNGSGTITRGGAGTGGAGGPGGGGAGGGGGSGRTQVVGPKKSVSYTPSAGGRGGDGITNASQNAGLGTHGGSGGAGGPVSGGGAGGNPGATLDPLAAPAGTGGGGGPVGGTGPVGANGTIGNAINGVSKLKILSPGTITGPQIG